MFGLILALASSAFGEVSDSIGKLQMGEKNVSIYTTGFLTLVFGALFYFFTAMHRGVFNFSIDSIPTFAVRMILEITLSWFTISALSRSNRTTFGFVRSLTIPLLLMADLLIGYAVTAKEFFGIAIIFSMVLLFILSAGKLDRHGLKFLFPSAILPVFTISLFKYDITHFNSIEAEQVMASLILIIFFLIMARVKAAENAVAFLIKPIFLGQAIFAGIAAALGGFAYLYAAPSVITAVLRSGSVLFSTVTGNFYFREKRPLYKVLLAVGIIAGLVLLI